MREREYWALLLKSEFTIWYIRVRRIYKQKTFRKTFANVAWGIWIGGGEAAYSPPLSKHTQTHFPYETLLEKLFLFSLRSNTLQIVYLTLSLLQCFLFFFPHSLSSKQNSRCYQSFSHISLSQLFSFSNNTHGYFSLCSFVCFRREYLYVSCSHSVIFSFSLWKV